MNGRNDEDKPEDNVSYSSPQAAEDAKGGRVQEDGTVYRARIIYGPNGEVRPRVQQPYKDGNNSDDIYR